MARPFKWRKICSMPENCRFGPLDANRQNEDVVIMTVDEYEAVRLIDLEGLLQDECAQRMNVARSTVTNIYSEARRKIAESLVGGKVLLIEGGEFRLCDGKGQGCGQDACSRRRCGRMSSANTKSDKQPSD